MYLNLMNDVGDHVRLRSQRPYLGIKPRTFLMIFIYMEREKKVSKLDSSAVSLFLLIKLVAEQKVKGQVVVVF